MLALPYERYGQRRRISRFRPKNRPNKREVSPRRVLTADDVALARWRQRP
jgi:hypothetical protein